MIEGTNVFGSPTWLDKWDQDPAIGMTLIDYEYYNGSLMGLKPKNKHRDVTKLKSRCGEFPFSIPMLAASTLGFPNVCFVNAPVERHGPYFYRAVVTDLNVTSIAGTFDLNFDHTLEWSGSSWKAFPLTFAENLTITPAEDYPDGSGWIVTYERFFADEGLVTFSWVLSLGTYQGDTLTTATPSADLGVVVNSLGSLSLTFVPADFNFQANPYDIFP